MSAENITTSTVHETPAGEVVTVATGLYNETTVRSLGSLGMDAYAHLDQTATKVNDESAS